jgi:hypothetical protein
MQIVLLHACRLSALDTFLVGLNTYASHDTSELQQKVDAGMQDKQRKGRKDAAALQQKLNGLNGNIHQLPLGTKTARAIEFNKEFEDMVG